MSDGTSTPKPLKIRVEFAVGTEADGRWITFGDDVELYGIAEWFRFTGEAISRMFNTGITPVRVRLVGGCGPNKIQSIKIVREFTGCGLKEAKDAVEGMWGGLVGVFEDGRLGEHMANQLKAQGNSVNVDAVRPDERGRMKGHEFLYVGRQNRELGG